MHLFPLKWPNAWPRTEVRARGGAGFRTTLDKACKNLVHELRLFGATALVIASNVPLRRDGRPYADGDPEDPGCAVWFEKDGEQRCIAADRWNHVAHNMQALAKSIEAMRGLERWGTGQILKRTLDAFLALPAPSGGAGVTFPDSGKWWLNLGVQPDAPLSVCEAAYKMQMKELGTTDHPQAYVINQAIAEARKQRPAAPA